MLSTNAEKLPGKMSMEQTTKKAGVNQQNMQVWPSEHLNVKQKGTERQHSALETANG